MIELYNGDCVEVLQNINKTNAIIVTDPPFNIGYKYATYKDKMNTDEYYNWLVSVLTGTENRFVCIHYPESLYELAIRIGKSPQKVVSWVYNSNTAKQHRDIAFFGVKPDFPWKDDNGVFRHLDNNKWFSLIMYVSLDALLKNGDNRKT